MDVPQFGAVFPPPPLSAGWTEHFSPTGVPYYYNAHTRQSTYTRPLPSFSSPTAVQVLGAKPKEKPVSKTPIPGTPWLRVKTNHGHTFFTHKAEKRSVWVVPDDIKDAVAALEREEAQQTDERDTQVARIKAEMKNTAKRKAPEEVPIAEIVVSKRARVSGEEGEGDEGDEDDGEDDGEESEEGDWQHEAAAQLAAEAEEQERIREEEEKRAKEAEEAEKSAKAKESVLQLNMPERIDLSIEEGKALFKTLLREKDINPLYPWDTSLPLFISDPRYVLLPSVSARREAFDEYCRERARELRQSQVKKEKDDPKEEFERLLQQEVTSTRTSWTDFRRKWKKDRRFYGWGRDEREREKRFRDFLKELGERKRRAAQEAETNFFSLLRESGVAKTGSEWKDVKRKVSNDPRYDAVGSSSLREELFNTFLKANSGNGSLSPHPDRASPAPAHEMMDVVEDAAEKERERKERMKRAVHERGEKIRAEREKLEQDIHRSRLGLSREESELQFRTLLTDAVRDPQATWESSLDQLGIDPRFTGSTLPVDHQFRLFDAHVASLRVKHLSNLHTLFETHAPGLNTAFSALPVDLSSSLPVKKLGYDKRAVEDAFARWQRERAHAARLGFDEMLHENAFVEFWGRLGKIGGDGIDGGVKRDDEGLEDEGEAGGGNVDMKALARTVDLSDMEKVLKNDKRYMVFEHIPEQREQWLRDYLSGLSAPKLSVHAGD
ncbi:hypothetical protein K488DRAFT_40430 [Vararia minispora EC-137]|uniref:Uncharacterized protein n=1 Tax=Vararia minispora EC-137 TaxID=1314806 RepID=A0ACB8QY12_9AGAM|nr:hypothetical protein K488DRAFT_40430 [Vararia minispora EC-137]